MTRHTLPFLNPQASTLSSISERLALVLDWLIPTREAISVQADSPLSLRRTMIFASVSDVF